MDAFGYASLFLQCCQATQTLLPAGSGPYDQRQAIANESQSEFDARTQGSFLVFLLWKGLGKWWETGAFQPEKTSIKRYN
jgi:hypothetical protein